MDVKMTQTDCLSTCCEVAVVPFNWLFVLSYHVVFHVGSIHIICWRRGCLTDCGNIQLFLIRGVWRRGFMGLYTFVTTPHHNNPHYNNPHHTTTNHTTPHHTAMHHPARYPKCCANHRWLIWGGGGGYFITLSIAGFCTPKQD